ncbi:MAG: hypothetical protein K0U37_06050 [Gammaproteobacteria bacterium]|nr:hypothetical protein [Gammaproteobacteria bacterium]
MPNSHKEDRVLLEAFSIDVLEKLREAQEEIERITKTIKEDEEEAVKLAIVRDDAFHDAEKRALATAKAEVLEHLRRAHEFTRKHGHLAPVVSEALEHTTKHGKALIAPTIIPSTDKTYKAGVRKTLENIRELAKRQSDNDKSLGTNPISNFAITQENFIAKMQRLALRLTLFRRRIIPASSTPKEQKEQEVLESYLQSTDELIASHGNVEFNKMINLSAATKEDGQTVPTEQAEHFLTELKDRRFTEYSEHQQKLSILQHRISRIDLPPETHALAATPQQNIRSLPKQLRKIEKESSDTDFQEGIKPVIDKAKSVYLQTRTIRHFQKWPVKVKSSLFSSGKMDKKTAVLRSLLLLNLNSETDARQTDRKTKKDEVKDINTYLKTVLTEAYPDRFTLDHDGNLSPIDDDEHTLELMRKALGLHLEDPDPTQPRGLLDPSRFDKEALDELASSESDNPLWVVLKSMKPVASNEFSLSDKISAYEEVTQLIADKKLGPIKATNLGLNVANAAIQVMRKNKFQTISSDFYLHPNKDHPDVISTHQAEEQALIKSKFSNMQSRIVKWEAEKHTEVHGALTTMVGRGPKKDTKLSKASEELTTTAFIAKKAILPPAPAKSISSIGPVVVREPKGLTPKRKSSEKKPRNLTTELEVRDELRTEVFDPLILLSKKTLPSNDDRRQVLDAYWKAIKIAEENPTFIRSVVHLLSKKGVVGNVFFSNTYSSQDTFYQSELERHFDALSAMSEETPAEALLARKQAWFDKYKSETDDPGRFSFVVSQLLVKEERFVADASLAPLILPVLLDNSHLSPEDINEVRSYIKMTDALITAYQKLSIDTLLQNDVLSRDEMATEIAKLYQSEEFKEYALCIQALSLRNEAMSKIPEKCGLTNSQSAVFSNIFVKPPQRIGYIVENLKGIRKAYGKLPSRSETSANAIFDAPFDSVDLMGNRFNGRMEAQDTLKETPKGLTQEEHFLRSLINYSHSSGWTKLSAKKYPHRVDGYLRDILPVIYPNIFNLNTAGKLEIIEDDRDTAEKIYRALGGKDSLGPSLILDGLLDPSKFDNDKLYELSQLNVANASWSPLWTVLRTIQPITDDITLEKKVNACKTTIMAIEAGKLGKTDKTIESRRLAAQVLQIIKDEQKAKAPSLIAEHGNIALLCEQILTVIKKLDTPSRAEQAKALFGFGRDPNPLIAEYEKFIKNLDKPLSALASPPPPPVIPEFDSLAAEIIAVANESEAERNIDNRITAYAGIIDKLTEHHPTHDDIDAKLAEIIQDCINKTETLTPDQVDTMLAPIATGDKFTAKTKMSAYQAAMDSMIAKKSFPYTLILAQHIVTEAEAITPDAESPAILDKMKANSILNPPPPPPVIPEFDSLAAEIIAVANEPETVLALDARITAYITIIDKLNEHYPTHDDIDAKLTEIIQNCITKTGTLTNAQIDNMLAPISKAGTNFTPETQMKAHQALMDSIIAKVPAFANTPILAQHIVDKAEKLPNAGSSAILVGMKDAPILKAAPPPPPVPEEEDNDYEEDQLVTYQREITELVNNNRDVKDKLSEALNWLDEENEETMFTLRNISYLFQPIDDATLEQLSEEDKIELYQELIEFVATSTSVIIEEQLLMASTFLQKAMRLAENEDNPEKLIENIIKAIGNIESPENRKKLYTEVIDTILNSLSLDDEEKVILTRDIYTKLAANETKLDISDIERKVVEAEEELARKKDLAPLFEASAAPSLIGLLSEDFTRERLFPKEDTSKHEQIKTALGLEDIGHALDPIQFNVATLQDLYTTDKDSNWLILQIIALTANEHLSLDNRIAAYVDTIDKLNQDHADHEDLDATLAAIVKDCLEKAKAANALNIDNVGQIVASIVDQERGNSFSLETRMKVMRQVINFIIDESNLDSRNSLAQTVIRNMGELPPDASEESNAILIAIKAKVPPPPPPASPRKRTYSSVSDAKKVGLPAILYNPEAQSDIDLLPKEFTTEHLFDDDEKNLLRPEIRRKEKEDYKAALGLTADEPELKPQHFNREKLKDLYQANNLSGLLILQMMAISLTSEADLSSQNRIAAYQEILKKLETNHQDDDSLFEGLSEVIREDKLLTDYEQLLEKIRNATPELEDYEDDEEEEEDDDLYEDEEEDDDLYENEEDSLDDIFLGHGGLGAELMEMINPEAVGLPPILFNQTPNHNLAELFEGTPNAALIGQLPPEFTIEPLFPDVGTDSANLRWQVEIRNALGLKNKGDKLNPENFNIDELNYLGHEYVWSILKVMAIAAKPNEDLSLNEKIDLYIETINELDTEKGNKQFDLIIQIIENSINAANEASPLTDEHIQTILSEILNSKKYSDTNKFEAIIKTLDLINDSKLTNKDALINNFVSLFVLQGFYLHSELCAAENVSKLLEKYQFAADASFENKISKHVNIINDILDDTTRDLNITSKIISGVIHSAMRLANADNKLDIELIKQLTQPIIKEDAELSEEVIADIYQGIIDFVNEHSTPEAKAALVTQITDLKNNVSNKEEEDFDDEEEEEEDFETEKIRVNTALMAISKSLEGYTIGNILPIITPVLANPNFLPTPKIDLTREIADSIIDNEALTPETKTTLVTAVLKRAETSIPGAKTLQKFTLIQSAVQKKLKPYTPEGMLSNALARINAQTNASNSTEILDIITPIFENTALNENDKYEYYKPIIARINANTNLSSEDKTTLIKEIYKGIKDNFEKDGKIVQQMFAQIRNAEVAEGMRVINAGIRPEEHDDKEGSIKIYIEIAEEEIGKKPPFPYYLLKLDTHTLEYHENISVSTSIEMPVEVEEVIRKKFDDAQSDDDDFSDDDHEPYELAEHIGADLSLNRQANAAFFAKISELFEASKAAASQKQAPPPLPPQPTVNTSPPSPTANTGVSLMDQLKNHGGVNALIKKEDQKELAPPKEREQEEEQGLMGILDKAMANIGRSRAPSTQQEVTIYINPTESASFQHPYYKLNTEEHKLIYQEKSGGNELNIALNEEQTQSILDKYTKKTGDNGDDLGNKNFKLPPDDPFLAETLRPLLLTVAPNKPASVTPNPLALFASPPPDVLGELLPETFTRQYINQQFEVVRESLGLGEDEDDDEDDAMKPDDRLNPEEFDLQGLHDAFKDGDTNNQKNPAWLILASMKISVDSEMSLNQKLEQFKSIIDKIAKEQTLDEQNKGAMVLGLLEQADILAAKKNVVKDARTTEIMEEIESKIEALQAVKEPPAATRFIELKKAFQEGRPAAPPPNDEEHNTKLDL